MAAKMKSADEGMLSEIEAAEYLGLKIGSLRTARCRDRGPAYIKLGRRILYRPDDLRAYVEARRIVPQAA